MSDNQFYDDSEWNEELADLDDPVAIREWLKWFLLKRNIHIRTILQIFHPPAPDYLQFLALLTRYNWALGWGIEDADRDRYFDFLDESIDNAKCSVVPWFEPGNDPGRRSSTSAPDGVINTWWVTASARTYLELLRSADWGDPHGGDVLFYKIVEQLLPDLCDYLDPPDEAAA